MKTNFIFCALIFFSIAAQSQINLGIKLGVNGNKLITSTTDLESNGFKYGFVGGAYINLGIGSWYIQPEVLFSQKGANLKATNTTNIADFTRNINSLDVPVLLGKSFGDKVKFRLNVGPVFGFPISAQQDGESRYKDALSGANVGYQAGIGLDISSIVLDLRYEGGLSGLGKNTFVVGTQTFKTDDRVSLFQLTLGFKITN